MAFILLLFYVFIVPFIIFLWFLTSLGKYLRCRNTQETVPEIEKNKLIASAVVSVCMIILLVLIYCTLFL